MVLGRLATQIAKVLRGKNDPRFSPHLNMKNHVIVINPDKVRLTGKKWSDKKYYRHTGYPGGIRELTAEKLHERKPTELVRKAVWGMLLALFSLDSWDWLWDGRSEASNASRP